MASVVALPKDQSCGSLLDGHHQNGGRSSNILPASNATRMEISMSRSRSASDAAAMELWDMIHSAPSCSSAQRRSYEPQYRHRYGDLQRNRTLVHPNLPQPTREEEKAHLAEVKSISRTLCEGGSCRCQGDANISSWFSEFSRSVKKCPRTASTGKFPVHHTRHQSIDYTSAAVRQNSPDCDVVNGSSSNDDAELRKRLSAALLGAKMHASSRDFFQGDTIKRDENGYLVGDEDIGESAFPSPTSTLCFPDPSSSAMNGGVKSDENQQELMDENDIVSPTSTMCFPDSSTRVMGTIKQNAEYLEQPYGNDYFIGVDEEKARMSRPRRRVTEIDRHSPQHTFVVCADTQIGMTSKNDEWETELEYCREAIKVINSLEPRPKFVCVCGDLVDMEYTFYSKPGAKFTKSQCDDIQDKQNDDFKKVWSAVHEDIALVCICGNHDIGNRPTKASIQKFKNAFGDDYLAFWANGTYNIILNNVLFSDPSAATDLFREQLMWLDGRLRYAREHDAAQIFVFAHHPWFLYHEDESIRDLKGASPYPPEWNMPGSGGFPDSYFHIKKEYRNLALDLFRRYDVSATFTGHFHQNLISKTSWGMDMIITAPLSMVFDSNGKPPPADGEEVEVNGRGVRVVEVEVDKKGKGRFTHRFELI